MDELEAIFKHRLNELVDRLVLSMQTRPQDTGLDIGEMRTEVGRMDDSLKLLNDVVESVRSQQLELSLANRALKAENEALQRKVADLEQYSRINNLEIKGVPYTQGDDCTAILTAIGDKINCTVSATDVDTVHRVPAMSVHKNIIVRFCSGTKKTEFMKARRARKKSRSVGFSGENTKAIFVNEHLSPDNKRLFFKAFALKKEKGWQFIWTENCQIKVRKSPDRRVLRIASDSDLSIIT
ncbi:hypothetical protein HPB49_006037 [Dermacentor silvarum]|uniref:Uncharacterized protein n=1 Tax=Dermacentor silvarum TaxID=543639 RepID=A0ACB8D345_DERSI|nr:hypothetical protein HPB49_006037 [Dermacentor silvarum]